MGCCGLIVGGCVVYFVCYAFCGGLLFVCCRVGVGLGGCRWFVCCLLVVGLVLV